MEGTARVETNFDAGYRRGISRSGQQSSEPDGAINSYGNAARAAGNVECSAGHAWCGTIAAARSKRSGSHIQFSSCGHRSAR
jgi:hypothetical protein